MEVGGSTAAHSKHLTVNTVLPRVPMQHTLRFGEWMLRNSKDRSDFWVGNLSLLITQHTKSCFISILSRITHLVLCSAEMTFAYRLRESDDSAKTSEVMLCHWLCESNMMQLRAELQAHLLPVREKNVWEQTERSWEWQERPKGRRSVSIRSHLTWSKCLGAHLQFGPGQQSNLFSGQFADDYERHCFCILLELEINNWSIEKVEVLITN